MFEQFPIISSLNASRRNYFTTYRNETTPTDEKIESWVLHKSYSIISFSANLLATGLGAAAVMFGACTIGAFKVVVFAITLGNIQPKISTGITWFGERTLGSIREGFSTFFEISTDIHSFCSKCIKTVKNILIAIGLEVLYLKICEAATRVFDFIGDRLQKGFEKASESEKNYTLDDKDLPIITPLNALRSNLNLSRHERSFTDILSHTTLSILTLPLNALAFSCSAAVSCILSAAFFSKALLYATTNIHLPFPTFFSLSSATASRTGGLLIENAFSCIIDIPITLYKVSKLTGLYQAMVKVQDLVFYIPQALFETV